MVNLELFFLITIPKMVYFWHEPFDLWLYKSKQLFWCLSRPPVKLFPHNTTDFYQILFWTKLSFVHLQVYFNQEGTFKKGWWPFGTVWNPICYSSRAQNHHHQHHSPPSLLFGQVFHFGNKTAGKQGKNWVLRAAGLWRLFFEPLTLCLLSSSPISPNWDSCLTLLKLFG